MAKTIRKNPESIKRRAEGISEGEVLSYLDKLSLEKMITHIRISEDLAFFLLYYHPEYLKKASNSGYSVAHHAALYHRKFAYEIIAQPRYSYLLKLKWKDDRDTNKTYTVEDTIFNMWGLSRSAKLLDSNHTIAALLRNASMRLRNASMRDGNPDLFYHAVAALLRKKSHPETSKNSCKLTRDKDYV